MSLSGIYSSTGFDLLSILVRVATRKNPVISIGPVDLSCSFLVVDAKKPDHPIVYASDTFEKLTGYSNSEILGPPDGIVEEGSVRKYTDNSVVHQMRHSVVNQKECQFSLINYKKGGVPFINLVTILPVIWDDNDVAYYVGFQVDLVDQPQAILNKMKDGSYVVNYKISQNIQKYIPPDSSSDTTAVSDQDELTPGAASPPVISPAEVPIGSPFTLSPDMIQSLVKNYPDFLFILSLRGLFLYVSSTSCQSLLEYPDSDVLGHHLSEFVHPADLVPVMRELRNTTPSSTLNTLCRFRRKQSGYTYLEIQGHIYEGDSTRRTKCYILTARAKQIPSIPICEINLKAETWCKVSPRGLFLSFSETPSSLFCDPDSLYGASILDFVHPKDLILLRNHLGSGYNVDFECRFITSGAEKKVYVSIFACVQQPWRFVQFGDTIEKSNGQGDIFDVMATTRTTSLQYEINEIRIQNKRIKDELGNPSVSKKKSRRNTNDTYSNSGFSPSTAHAIIPDFNSPVTSSSCKMSDIFQLYQNSQGYQDIHNLL
ncbi:blue light receptor [Nowakowskiella sp. JEL0407]|nr:blue light receptor [Nowakowskiella sp. JEL0407]